MIKKLTTQCSWKASEWVQCLAALIDCILAVLCSYWLGTWLGSLSHRYALLPICNPRTSQRVHYFASLDMYRIEPYMKALNCGFWGCLRVLESITFVSEYCVLCIAYCNCVARQRGKKLSVFTAMEHHAIKRNLNRPFPWWSTKLFTTNPHPHRNVILASLE